MFDLSRFSLSEMIECGTALRLLGADERSMEEVADRIVRYLYDHLVDGRTGERACALVRFFKTHPYGDLDEDRRRFARELLGRPPESPALRCLTLLATAGDRPDWNRRERSREHQVIPLPSGEGLHRAPMIAQLVAQLGLEAGPILRPDPAILLDPDQRSYNVFHIPRACGSPFVPAQDEFVIPCGIESVLGFGGVLPRGDRFALILFSRVPISRATADLFRPLALSIKLAVLPFDGGVVCAPGGPAPPAGDGPAGGDHAAAGTGRPCSRAAALEQLLEAYERCVRERAGALEQAPAEFRQPPEPATDAAALDGGPGRIARRNRRADTAGGQLPADLTPGPQEVADDPPAIGGICDVTARLQAGRRLTTQLATTRVLAEAATLAEATPRILQAIGEGLGWDFAASWLVDRRALVLRCTATWHRPSVRVPGFDALTRATTFAPDLGFPGHIWAGTRPDWIVDFSRDGDDPRVPTAAEEGLHGALGLPIRLRGEILGVVECFSREAQPTDEVLLAMMAGLGSQIGQFIERKRFEEQLLKLSRAVEQSASLVIITDAAGHIEYVNPKFTQVTGYTPAEVIGQNPRILRSGETPPRGYQRLWETITSGKGWFGEFRNKKKDGSLYWASASISPVRDPHGVITHFVAIQEDITPLKQADEALRAANDELERRVRQRTAELVRANETLRAEITERERAEERLRRVDRARRALGSCGQALIRASDEMQFLRELCRIIVEVAGYRLCWVGYAEHDEAKTVRPVAHAGYEEGYLKTVNVSWADTGQRGHGPIGTAIRTREPAVLKDVAQDPNFAHRRTEALKRGYASVVGVPLVSGTDVLGAFAIYASEPDAFDDEEVGLLRELADDLSFGVVTLRTRAERERADAALRESERKYRHLFDNLGDAAFLIDADTGCIVDTNKQGEELLGRSREAIIGMHEGELQRSDRVEGSRLSSTAPGEWGRAADYESQVLGKDGTPVPVHVRAAPQAICGKWFVLGLYRDITDRKRAEEALRRAYDELERRVEERTAELSRANALLKQEIADRKRAEKALRTSERLYRQLTEGTLDAIIVTDEQGAIRLFNPAARRVFGYAESEVLGRPLTLLMPPEDQEFPEQAVGRDVVTRQARCVGRRVEQRGRRKGGEIFPLEISLSAIDLPEGIIFLGAIRDLTERRRMQAMIVQAEKLASLGLLSAGLAHEINNPLAYVANNLAVLERDYRGLFELLAAYDEARPALGAACPELAERIDRIAEEIDLPYIRETLGRMLSSTMRGVKRISDIVQNLRGFARLDQATVDRVDLHEAIAGSLELIRGQLERRNIEVEQAFGELPPVVCAPAQINQVVLNLLVNAMQAIEGTGRGGGRIEIRTRARGDEAVIEVADDGCGIPAEVVPRIFDPFFTTKPIGQGTGLGLAISHGIVADHGGSIEVESHPGQGSCFRVILPAGGGRTCP